jgi:hypothetical protein
MLSTTSGPIVFSSVELWRIYICYTYETKQYEYISYIYDT